MKEKLPLNVFSGAALSGVLDRSDVEEDTFLFGYEKNAAAHQAVSLTMPVRADQYDSMAGLLPIFDMNLPEGALRERLRLQFAKSVPHFDDLDLLAIVGASQIGRLRYSHRPVLEDAVPEQDLKEILTYRGSADLFAHLLERFATYSGISGMQPKVLVRDSRAPEKVTHRGATHIVKAFDSAEYPDLAANEWICTSGAAAAGIETPRVALSENRRFLVVERFDRTAEGGYLGVEDFCVLEGMRSHGRYDGSYEGIAKRIAQFVSPGALAHARAQFALTVAYSCTIGNGDAHLKNFSLLYASPNGEVRLAPAYDIVSTVPYLPRDTLALALNGSKQFPDRGALVRFVRHVTGMSERAALRLIDQAAIGVNAAIAQAKQYAELHADAARFAEALVAAMVDGLNRLAAGQLYVSPGDRRL